MNIINDSAKVTIEMTEDNVTSSGVVNSGIETTQSGILSPLQRPVAYEITDKYFGTLQVAESANAWWMDRIKVQELIRAFKSGYKVEEAMVYAGISEGQWKYFLKVHPEFSTVKERCQKLQFMRARDTMNTALDDPQNARWFLGKYDEPDEQKVDPTQVQNIQNNVTININEDKVKSVARDIIAEIGKLAERAGVHSTGSNSKGGDEGDNQ